jgi:hypothetical protein
VSGHLLFSDERSATPEHFDASGSRPIPLAWGSFVEKLAARGVRAIALTWVDCEKNSRVVRTGLTLVTTGR